MLTASGRGRDAEKRSIQRKRWEVVWESSPLMPLGPSRSAWSVAPLWTKFGWRCLARILQIMFARGSTPSFRLAECGILQAAEARQDELHQGNRV